MAAIIPNEVALTALAEDALANWDIDVVQVKPHSHRENTVFKVRSAGGEVYALRVHRPGYHDLAALESEHVWTTAMQEAGLAVPEAVNTRDGDPYVLATLPDSQETRHVGLVKWISGVTLEEHLGDHPDDAAVQATYESLGKLIADFHLATAQWSPPGTFKRHAWDAQGLVGEAPFWGRFWELDAASAEQNAELSEVRGRLLTILSSLPRTADVYGMIHADLNTENVLRDGDTLSVIDFDDAGFGWHAFDLAVAVWDGLGVLTGQSHFDVARESLLQGYRERRPGSVQLEMLVPLFILVRSLMLLRWMQDRPESGYTEMIPPLLKHALDQARGIPWSDFSNVGGS